MNDTEYQAAQDRRADKLTAALLAVEGLLSVIDRHGLELSPIDHYQVEQARAVLAASSD